MSKKNKKQKEVITTKTLDIDLLSMKNSMPLVGWHDPYGTFEHEGETWNVSIAGGVRALIIERPDGVTVAVDLSALAGQLVEDIKNLDGKKWKRFEVDDENG